MTTTATQTVRSVIARDLSDEPQSVVQVTETAKLRPDLNEYVLTDQLAHDFAEALERVIASAGPTGQQTDKIGIWVSGFFGSGKSHFAKLVGHLLADTPLGGGDTARSLFRRHLQPGRSADNRLAEAFHQASTHQVTCHVVPFDITAVDTPVGDKNVGFTFLRTFYQSIGLSEVFAFAERELELQASGLFQQFEALYQQKAGRPWVEDKSMTSSSAVLARCLAELQPRKYATGDDAHQSLRVGTADVETSLSVDGVVERLLRWLEDRQKQADQAALQLIFVADEVGAWAGRDLKRIEQIRALVESLGRRGQGRIWLLATSQEKLSDVVQNAPFASSKEAMELLQRLEARFTTNVHLESSEVGSVIEERVLRKLPTTHNALVQLWTGHEQQLRDVAESPGLELGANYPRADRDPFERDYPFLPYQVQAAADVFGGMRGVKVSSGARSMIRIVFDATRTLADSSLGAVVSWDRIFDSANRENEFQDEQYLGSQGLTYLRSADRDVTGTPITPSRLLKTLWLVQQSARIPRTPRNLARLLVDEVDTDVLRLEQDVAATLEALAQKTFARQETATGQWRFLTQDEVTVEKLVRRIAEEVKAAEVRNEVFKLFQERVERLLPGTLTMGKSSTSFHYATSLNGTPLKNDSAPVRLRVDVVREAPEHQAIADAAASDLDVPEVRWVVEQPARLDDQVRRVLAISRLANDEEYRRVATERTRGEADRLVGEADELRRNAGLAAERALDTGSLYWAGTKAVLAPASGKSAPGTKLKVEEALRNRLAAVYYRFDEGDRAFNPANVDKLFAVPAVDRAGLDPALALFSTDGHVNGNNVLVEVVTTFLRTSTKNSGQDALDDTDKPPFGWPSDLIRYVAAALFVDGKVSASDRSGKRLDDPRAPGARQLFVTAAFKTTRLDVEEDSLTPVESSQAISLLTDLGFPPSDGGEIALKEAALQLAAGLAKRSGLVEQAKQVDLPLPTSYDGITTAVDALSAAASRVKVVRALLAHEMALRQAVADLKKIEDFAAGYGLEQYRRSQQLLSAAEQAGLLDDPVHGQKVTRARDEIEALKQQRRVLDEWSGAYRDYRQEVLDAFKAAYAPLRQELHQRAAAARADLVGMPELDELQLGDRTSVRVEFLGEGRSLAEVSLPELRDEQQLLAANAAYSIAHLRSALAALDGELGRARAMVLDLHAAELQRRGEAAKIATWQPASTFAGKRFTTEAEVDAVFDAERDQIKALIRAGKTVQVV